MRWYVSIAAVLLAGLLAGGDVASLAAPGPKHSLADKDQALRLQADVLMQEGNLGKALKTLEKARVVNPRDEATLARLAACHYLTRKQDEELFFAPIGIDNKILIRILRNFVGLTS